MLKRATATAAIVALTATSATGVAFASNGVDDPPGHHHGAHHGKHHHHNGENHHHGHGQDDGPNHT
jgi:Spy/CpxP family protein refolding chaperone